MRYGFEAASIGGGVALLAIGNLLVIEILPFLVPVFNMMGGLLIVLPPVMSLYMRYRTRREIEEQFVSFIMDLTDSIDSGMTLPMALEHCSKRDYLSLSRHIDQLVAQVNWGIPFRKALETFAGKTRSRHVQRAASTIIETYRVGGKISDTLNSVSKSMTTINKLDAERRSSVYSQVVTSYLIFFVFIFIIMVIQVAIIPSLSPETIGELSLSGTNAYAGNSVQMLEGGSRIEDHHGIAYRVSLARVINETHVEVRVDSAGMEVPRGMTVSIGGLPLHVSTIGLDSVTGMSSATFLFGDDVPLDYAFIFTAFIIIQGFFAGLATGKMAEGSLSAGLKHSLILVFAGYVLFSLAIQLPQIKFF